MWSKLLILSITLFIKECLTCSNDPQCTFGSKYLLVQMLDRINSPVSWYEAENYCKDVYGTHLASIHSEEDVANSIKTCKQAVGIDKCWIGLNDINNEGVWTYSDNTPVDITAWAPGEPTGDLVATTEDCVYISPEKGYGWNDFDCEGSFRNKIKVYSFLCNNPEYDPELECHCECDVCQIEGDPHITTFDKLLYHFMGECTYLYVTPCFNNYNTLPIEISGSHIQCFDNRGDRTCLDKVYVNLYDNNNEIAAQLKLGENYLAEWTGVGTLGWSGNAQLNEYITWSSNPTRQLYILKSITNVLDVQFYLYDTTDHEIMDARIQVARDYDPNGWGAFVNIWLAQCYAEESDVCGLCGHYDFNSLNDFAYVDDEGNLLTISTEGVSVVKSMTQDAWERTHLFGEKWINEELTEKEDCEVIGSPPDTECATVVEDFCKTFWDRECSCPYEYQEDYYSVTWFEGCVWDTCSLCADLDWSQTSYEEALHSGCFAFANITCYHQCREIETNTLQPTYQPTFRPTPRPTLWPTNNPTPRPTQRPTLWPTNNPTQRPTQRPTLWPTNNPTQRPTLRPTPNPTQRPTPNPTPRPTLNPTPRPTPRPTLNPTANPTPRPTPRPTLNPTPNPTPRPTPTPTLPPLEVPVNSETTESPDYWWHWVTQPKPTPKPTLRPTTTLPPIETQAVTTTAPPTLRPTYRPTLRPTYRPTNRPTPRPTYRPTNRPTPRPTYRPTNRPTPRPTNRPTPSPTLSTEPNAEPTDDYWYHWNKGSKKP